MFFNSIHFALFLPIVFIFYWFLAKGKIRIQNTILIIASYYFYACWDWRFLFLLIFSTVLDFYTGIQIFEANSIKKRKIWLWISITINLGFLGVFKYYNFFIESFSEAFELIGFHVTLSSLSIILPVGISFYTFHGLSYVIDIYKNRIHPEKDFLNYSLFVSFFPLLVAGPIERATHLLPQIKNERNFDYLKAVDGLRQILWGLFKKVVIADNCAMYANQLFNHTEHYSGMNLVMGAFFFTIQIYCDFSGYSDIALGTARLFGIELIKNFAFPYFSRNIAEFWRRWHISLSSWFKDYLYIPLGGSKGGAYSRIRNTFIIFIVSGFWHGANWTFIVWGFLNALFIMPSILMKNNRNHLDVVAKGKILPSFFEFTSILFTFSLTMLAWVFFRATSIGNAFTYIQRIFTVDLFSFPTVFPVLLLSIVVLFCIIEWLGRENSYAIEKLFLNRPSFIRYVFYLLLILCLFLFEGKGDQFIYFQF
jgi:alginate O-acetyltransferase complex protein AlgI